ISGLAMAALSVGLGLAACAATGGLGVALGAAAIGVGVVDAAWQTAEYFEDASLSNTAEDKSQGLMSPEQMQGAEFWLAVAWVSAGIDLASGIKVVGLLRAGASIGKALRTAGHVGKEAKLIGATLAKNVGAELRRLGSHIDADPAWAMAGGRGAGPYDRVGRTPQVPNEDVRALRPDGWASEGSEGSNVHAMSMGDQEGFLPDTWSGGERLHSDSRGMSIQEPRVPGRGRRPDIEPLDVDVKGGPRRLFRDVVGDELERDHWPSFAAIKSALESKIGDELDPQFARWLYTNTNTLALTESMHTVRRTTGGRNTAAQVAGDGADLQAAFQADAADFKRLALQEGFDLEEVEEVIEAFRAVNEEMGLYRWLE
ncbi:MAG: hypothetical protein AB8H79_09000, partial [Myxococcota bacterium]